MGGGAAYRADRVVEEGAKSGCPDFELWVPACVRVVRWSDEPMAPPVICALELKAPGERPRREVPGEWWLAPCDGSTHYGLRPEQRHWLSHHGRLRGADHGGLLGRRCAGVAGRSGGA